MINLEDKRKAKKSLRHQEIILRSLYLQQLNENVKVLFKDNSCNLLRFPASMEREYLNFQVFSHTSRDLGKYKKNQHKLFTA